MFVIPTQKVGFTHRVVAMLAAFAMVLWSVGVYGVAQAANLAEVSDLLSDSAPEALSSHTITFKTVNALTNENIKVTFPTASGEFDFNGLNESEITIDGNGLSGTANSINNGSEIVFTSRSVSASEEVTIEIPLGKITNPNATGSYEIKVQAGDDTGYTRVAIVDTVTVSAIVETIFNFEVKGVAASTAVDGTNTTTLPSTATEIDFGVLQPDTMQIIAQELTVETNALNGFAVTVEKDGELRSANGADINTFIDGSNEETPKAWAPPTKDIDNNKTWGHWGMTSNDTDLSFGGDWVAVQDAASSTVIFSHTGPADGTTPDKGIAQVAYGIEISAYQEAADDYTAILTYIATPTF